MRDIFKLPDNTPAFFKSDVSENLLVEFNTGDNVLYVGGIVDVKVVKGAVEIWGFAMTVDSPTTTLYSSGSHGLISIASAGGKKAIVSLEKSSRAERWKTFMNEYMPGNCSVRVDAT